MKRFLKYILILLLFSVGGITNAMADFSNETLHYVISYKWGLVSKDAGNATVSLRKQGSNYNIILTARSLKWADRIFSVRDTLKSMIRVNGFVPLSYEKIAHEGGKYRKDVITYKYSGSSVEGICKRYSEKKGKISQSEKVLKSNGNTFDFLSVFYYLRTLDFNNLMKKSLTTTVFSGSKVETLTVKCLGLEEVQLKNKTKERAYHIRFNFTIKGKSKSSDDIDAWISNDSRHIPLLLIGKLPVGQIKVFYTG